MWHYFSMRKKHVSTKVFIETWEDCTTLAEVCRKLDMVPTSASSRATNLRGRKIHLKIMPRCEVISDEDLLAEAMQAMPETEEV
jgi:hypothetical protein